MNIFVAKLNYDTQEDDLRSAFEAFGEVDSVKIIMDKFTGRSKGFGFVEMEGHEARKAIAALDGKVVGEKSLRVQFENPKGKGGKRPRR